MDLSYTEIIAAARQVALGHQAFISAGDLSDTITTDSGELNKRDFIRQVFFDLGIEVEFSGKNQHEKGVVIDIDEDKTTTLGLNADALRFGQTVVKAIT